VILHYMCNEVAARGELLVLPQRVPHLGSWEWNQLTKIRIFLQAS
jgi:hypothetical protein